MGVAEEDLDRIMHISYQIGDSVLMGSDTVASCGGVQPAGGGFAISYSPATKDEADAAFSSLMEGGEIQMEMAETFWGSYFGSGKDKFGINWMINVDMQG
jgi:PhnB protein